MPSDVLETENLIKQKEVELKGKDDHLGITLMGYPQYTSAVRLSMFASHMKEFTCLNEGEPPQVFTSYENIFGQNSSSLVVSDDDYEVVAKIDRFEDNPNYMYALIIYNEEKNFYHVIFKKISENLTEKFGYKYNNSNLDSLEVGDKIKKGDVLYKSSSFDEDNNYCYGKNATVAYILDPCNVEDAYGIRKGFAKDMQSRLVENIRVQLNDNEFLLNLYGDSREYRGLPRIGEKVKENVLAAKRKIINSQILFDLKKSNEMKILPDSDTSYYSKGVLTDIEIYSNKSIEELEAVDYNEQIISILKNQERFYSEILEVTQDIIDSGAKYSDDIGYIYSRSKKILDPQFMWKDVNESVFSNIVIYAQVDRDIKMFAGSKMTGRYGDKGVISVIRDDDEMPFTKDGRVVDVIINPLSCPNRLNPFQWIEVELTHAAEIVVQQMKTKETHEERWDMMKRFMKYFNERGEYDQLIKYYEGLSETEKDEFWESVYKDGIYINYPPMWEDMPALDKIAEIEKEFNIDRDQVYVKKYGRIIPIMHKVIVGKKYMIKLKQTSEKNFSARSTGSLSQQGVPEKSNKVRTNEKLYPTTPIAIGRDEDNNLAIGTDTFMLAKLHLFYRTSPFARRDIGQIYTKDILNFKKFKIKPGYKNRIVEILNAKLKSMGGKIDFGFDGLRVKVPDNGDMKLYEYRGKQYISTKTKMREIIIDDVLRMNFAKLHIDAPADIKEKMYQEYKYEVLSTKVDGNLFVKVGEKPWDKQ